MSNIHADTSSATSCLDMLNACHDQRALNYYERHGASTAGHAFAIASILHANLKVWEAACFYRRAFDLYRREDTEFLLPEILLQARLLCLLKSSRPLPSEEVSELEKLSPELADYMRGLQLAWQDGKTREGLGLIGNALENFHSGEEIDRLYLELALRHAPSGLKTGSGLNTTGAIPNHLYMYWDELPPEEIRNNIQYHQDLLGSHFTCFDRASATAWLQEHYGEEVAQVFQTARTPAEGADLLRLYVILANGGWWLDADLRLRSMEAWNTLRSSSAASCHFFMSPHYGLRNDLFGAAPGNAYIARAVRRALTNCFQYPSLYTAFKTGPGVLGRVVNRAMCSALKDEEALPELQIDNPDHFHAAVEELKISYRHCGPFRNSY